MTKKTQLLDTQSTSSEYSDYSPIDIIRKAGGQSRAVSSKSNRRPDSMLAVYKNRFTYTFVLDSDVASIHFDKEKGEIFYKGRNIRHINLEKSQKAALYNVQYILSEDDEAECLLSSYLATLTAVLTDN